MRWVAYNGSPRGPKSNTHVMLERVREGMESAGQVQWRELYLNKHKRHGDFAAAACDADGIIFAYPLYTDSMPGVAVQFLETLCGDENVTAALRGREVAAVFLVHSGFPEGVQTAHLEQIHIRLCEALGLRYGGTIRKPASEGVRLMPASMQKRLFSVLRDVGVCLIRGDDIHDAGINQLVRYEHMGPLRKLLLRVGAAVGITNMYWIQMLKRHGAWEKRFDAPYGPAYTPRGPL